MQSSRIMTKDGSTVELTDSRISDTDAYVQISNLTVNVINI